eukprot:SAG31_NODE_21923_length_537_cov_7.867580_1_plen_63_part_10
MASSRTRQPPTVFHCPGIRFSWPSTGTPVRALRSGEHVSGGYSASGSDSELNGQPWKGVSQMS